MQPCRVKDELIRAQVTFTVPAIGDERPAGGDAVVKTCDRGRERGGTLRRQPVVADENGRLFSWGGVSSASNSDGIGISGPGFPQGGPEGKGMVSIHS